MLDFITRTISCFFFRTGGPVTGTSNNDEAGKQGTGDETDERDEYQVSKTGDADDQQNETQGR